MAGVGLATAGDVGAGAGVGVGVGVGVGSGAAAVITGGAVTAAGGEPAGGVADEPGCDTTALNAVLADENGPDPAAFAAPLGGLFAPLATLADGDDAPAPFGGVLPVDDTMAMTTPAMSSAIEQDSAATTHIGGRRL